MTKQKKIAVPPHSSSTGSVESVNSRPPHDGKSYLGTTTGNPKGRSGFIEPTGQDAFEAESQVEKAKAEKT